MSGAATPGLFGTDAGIVVRPWVESSLFIDATNVLKPSIPASLAVAPSSYLPKIATTSSVLSSQILVYSVNFPVVVVGLGASVAVAFTASVVASVQPEAFGRK